LAILPKTEVGADRPNRLVEDGHAKHEEDHGSRNQTFEREDSGRHDARARRASKGAGKLPAVIVVQEAFGLNGNIKQITERIAAEGYQAIAPNFYYRAGARSSATTNCRTAIGLMIGWTDAQIVDDVRSTVNALEADAGSPPIASGITGFCMADASAISPRARCRASVRP